MYYLRLSTAGQEITFGQAVDPTTADTEVGTGTIAATDIKIHKAGAVTLANKASGGATYISNGVWYCVLDATDTNTLGSGCLYVHVAGKMAMKVEFCVLPAAIYDALIAGTGNFPADVLTMATDSLTAAALKTDAVTEIALAVADLLEDEWGTARAGSSNTIQLATGARGGAVDDYYNNRNATIFIRQGSGAGQERQISDYTGSTKTCAVSPDWTPGSVPDATSVYCITFS